MAYRIAINGYGRIGRCILRAFYEQKERNTRVTQRQNPVTNELEWNHTEVTDCGNYGPESIRAPSVEQTIKAAETTDDQPHQTTSADDLHFTAINDLADMQTLAHLTRYDSTHGRFPGTVQLTDQHLRVNGDEIAVFQEPGLDRLPWQEQDIDLVLECSGAFGDRAGARQHISQGAARVLFSQPAESDVDATIVYGINHHALQATDTIISGASCTTNCVVPVLKAMDESFGIVSGVITTIHSAMNDQPVIDSYHNADLRKTRSAMQSIIPVDTGLARGIERILPEMQGLLQAQAIRVPTVNVSVMDLTISLKSPCSVAEVNTALTDYSDAFPANVLGVSREPLASCDYNHDLRSGIVDLNQTRVAPANLVKLLVWFDNEWAYANRMLDVARHLSQLD
ncbi:MAG: erythrose-4-phosphate dehydrogenase [Gammaproteobacteria bacterium]|nr:erythrose-4-phosphate dehydrogenase [Gammaproteobacteria bacterium]MCY4358031.1 erythrose-4-phosphate dehydrogenase [Gammaproteobacteria bacterium]